MAKTRAQQNRAMRQEEYRNLLSSQGHLQHIIELMGKLSELDKDLDSVQVSRLKHVIDTKLKLINKFIPDLKSVEVTGEGGDEFKVTVIERKIV